MNLRRLFFMTTVASAIGIPYLFQSDGVNLLGRMRSWIQSPASKPSWFTRARDQSAQWMTRESRAASTYSSAMPSIYDGRDATGYTSSSAQRSQTHSVSLRDALNFNITPAWVANHWPEVSTATAELDLRGLRVALVTGTKPDDILGSLTYYFDDEHRLQRVSIDGQTGDPSRLTGLVTTYHGLRPERSLDAGLFTKRWNGQPKSVLWIGRPRIVRTDSDNSQFIIKLEINRTDGKYRLSDDYARFMTFRARPNRF